MKTILVLAVTLTGSAWCSVLEPKGTKVQLNDVREYTVVVSTAPEPQEAYAAKVLAEGIGKITGFTPQIVNEGGTDVVIRCFAVGKTARAASKGIAPLAAEQGYRLVVKDGDVIVLGGSRGPFHGVMALLEEDWGARWFSRYAEPIYPVCGGECGRVGTRDPTILTVVPREYAPPFDIREWLQVTAMNADWSLFNRLMNVSYFIRTTKEKGGGYCAEPYFFHTYEMLVPWAKHKDEHPEYFTLTGGKRLKNDNTMAGGQVCYTCKGVEDVCVAHFEDVLKKYPDARVFGISANDNLNLKCECPACAALIAKEGVVGAQIDLANRVARRLKAKWPDLILHTSAYSATEYPPPSIRPDDNVAIFYAPIRDRANPLVRMRDQKESLKRKFFPWTDISKRVYVWDYARLPFAPCPNFDVVRDNLQLMRERGVRGVFIEDYEPTANSLDVMKAWVFAKLLWNPDWDARALADEFVTGFYGPAAEAMRMYVGIQLAAYDRYVKTAKPGDGLVISPDETDRMRHLLQDAYRASKDSPTVRKAVAREFVSFLVCRLAACRPDAKERYAKDLELMHRLTDEYDICIDEHGNNVSRQDRNKPYFARWKKKLARASGSGSVPVYAPSSVVLSDCVLWNGVTKEKDVGALANPNAYRLCVPGDWLIQWDFTDLLAAGGGMQTEYVCRARIKPELKVTHQPTDKAIGIHVWMSGRDICPGAAVTFADLPKDNWGFAYFFRINVYSSSGVGYFYTTTETLDKLDHMLFDYLEFIPSKDFEDTKLLKKLPQIVL